MRLEVHVIVMANLILIWLCEDIDQLITAVLHFRLEMNINIKYIQ